MGICQSANNKSSSNNQKNEKSTEVVSGSNQQSNQQVAKREALKQTKAGDLVSSRIPKDMRDIEVDVGKFTTLSTGTPLDNYITDKKLGEGSYGSVFRVKHKDMGIYRAMKKITGSGCSKDPEKEKEILNEIEMLKSLDHPNIVKVFEFYNTKEGYFIITEYCKGGELFDKIVDHAPFEESAAAYIMYQILSAVFYCHNLNIIHRDLKPENILLEEGEKDPAYLNIKIIDFGTAKLFDKNKAEKKVIGSAYYIAPEVLLSKYSEKCDIWSCGVIMYILLSGKPPFAGSDEEIMEKIKKGKFDLKGDVWPKVSSEAKDLIKHMLEMNTLSRSSAQKALTHKWFKKYKMRERFTSVATEKLKHSIENIKKFKSENKLQQAALAFLVHNSLHLPEIKDLVKIFRGLDGNGDGRITKIEMCDALTRLYGLPDIEEEVDEIYRNVDNDNNGYIEYEEYIRASIDKASVLSEGVLKYTFKYFDKDGSGQISGDEIGKVLFSGLDQKTSEKFTKELMAEIDSDSNAEINYDEFKTMMIKLFN